MTAGPAQVRGGDLAAHSPALTPGPRHRVRDCCPGDQAGQRRDRCGHRRVGELGCQHHRWRRDLIGQQTELHRLHGSPPWPVTAVQPAPGRPHGHKERKPGRTRPAGHPAAPASPWRPRPPRRPLAQIGPCRRDQRLAAIRQHQQQLQPAMPAQPPSTAAPALQRMPRTRDVTIRGSVPVTSPPPAAEQAPAARGVTAPHGQPGWHYPRPGQSRSPADRPARHSAMLAAIRSTCPSPPEHGSTPASSAPTAASKSTAAITVPSASLPAAFHGDLEEILARKATSGARSAAQPPPPGTAGLSPTPAARRQGHRST